MATRQEITEGLEFLIRESRRIGERFDAAPAEWSGPGDDGGWTSKQVFGHVAGIGGIAHKFAESVAAASPDVDAGEPFNMAIINAGLVKDRDDRTTRDIVDELAANYRNVIDWVKAAPDSVLEVRRTVGGYTNLTVSDIFMTAIVLHAIQHVYRAAARFP